MKFIKIFSKLLIPNKYFKVDYNFFASWILLKFSLKEWIRCIQQVIIIILQSGKPKHTIYFFISHITTKHEACHRHNSDILMCEHLASI